MVKKTIVAYMLILILFGCVKRYEIPKESYITSRYTVFDEEISPKLNVCPRDTITNFIENNGDDCLFKLDEYIFEVEYKMILSKDGHMVQLNQHSATEDIDYEKFGLLKDYTDPKKLNSFDFYIRFSTSKEEIIDGYDTLTIERIFPKEKLIFVENKNITKGRRYIYQYN